MKTYFNQHIVIVEDIIDTGTTIRKLLEEMETLGAASVKLVALLSKQKAEPFEFPIDYCAFDIADEFVVGYGMDYNGAGRNLKNVYVRRLANKGK